MQIPRNPIPILALISMFAVAESMRFEIQSSRTKCISEEIRNSTITVGKYSVVNPNENDSLPKSHKITVRVTSPHGHRYHYVQHVESGDFAFTAVETGDYIACFSVSEARPPVDVTIDFDWRTGVAAKDWSKVAKIGQVAVMELELKKLYDTVSSIQEEMFYLSERGVEMTQLNRATNSKMAIFGFLSIVLCLAVAALQFWHLNTYFQRKKILRHICLHIPSSKFGIC